MTVEIPDPQLRSLAKLAIAMFVAHRQGVQGHDHIEKEVIRGFAEFHSLDRDTVTHFYLSAMESLSRAPFVYCGIHSKATFIDAILQNPSSPDQVMSFVYEGLAGVKTEMNYAGAEPDLIIPP